MRHVPKRWVGHGGGGTRAAAESECRVGDADLRGGCSSSAGPQGDRGGWRCRDNRPCPGRRAEDRRHHARHTAGLGERYRQVAERNRRQIRRPTLGRLTGVDAVNAFRVSAGRSRTFALLRVFKFDVSAVQQNFETVSIPGSSTGAQAGQGVCPPWPAAFSAPPETRSAILSATSSRSSGTRGPC